MKYIIANWKANKSYQDVLVWARDCQDLLNQDLNLKSRLENGELQLIVCPPTPFLIPLQVLTELPNTFVGAQSISSYQSGAYTGEVTGEALSELCSHVIIGHSERRSIFQESEQDIENKVARALEFGLKPILCIRGPQDTIYSDVSMIAYEPVESIGTGQNMPAEQVVEKKHQMNLPDNSIFIYGGSVKPETTQEYMQHNEIAGLLVGGASLKPDSFLGIARNA